MNGDTATIAALVAAIVVLTEFAKAALARLRGGQESEDELDRAERKLLRWLDRHEAQELTQRVEDRANDRADHDMIVRLLERLLEEIGRRK